MASRLLAAAAKAARTSRRVQCQDFSVRAFASQALALPDDRFMKYNSPVPVPVDHTDVLRTPVTNITTLDNGMRVASESSPLAETATIGVWIDAGSRYETQATNGTAHMLEHMIFKGTKRRSVDKLEEEIENLGGHLNAYTSREQTTYYAKVLKQDVPAAVDVLSDILQHSKFDERHIERERKVILREMEEVETQTDEVLFDHLHATAFQHSPLGRTILGPAENIKKLSQANLRDYIATHYTGPRMVVAASGAVDHGDLVSLVEKSFTSLSKNTTTAADLIAREPALYTGSEVRIRDDDLPLAHFAIAVQGAPWSDPDAIPLMVMQAMLGSWNKNAGAGVNSGVMAFNTNYSDTGLFGVHATAQGSLLLHLDGTSPVAEDIGRQLLIYGRRVPLVELFARIDAVDVATVKRVAERFIFDKDVVLASIGPTQNLPDYNWFRRRTYWLRY
eukprot:jgi/Mesen1/3527/ME000197S02544